jgi:hypothetical protein
VRFWWLAAAALVAAAVYMFVVNYVAWRREAWLIRNGTLVQAKLEKSGGEVLPGRPVEPEQGVLLSFDWNGGRHESWGTLWGRAPKEVILTKSTVTIRVDPADPDHWTYRKEPPSLAADLLGAALAFALAPLAMLAAVTLRRGVLRTWRDGEAADAVVVARHSTALAPATRALKCTAAAPQVEETDGAGTQTDPAGGGTPAAGTRVHTVYVPLRHGDAGQDLLRVILPPRAGGRPLAAAWFE